MISTKGNFVLFPFRIQNKLGYSMYGDIMFSRAIYGKPSSKYHGIYQMRQLKEGYKPVQMRFYEPKTRHVPQQVNNRLKFSMAINYWQNLTQQEKSVYNSSVVLLFMSGYAKFIQNYLIYPLSVYGFSVFGLSEFGDDHFYFPPAFFDRCVYGITRFGETLI